MKVIALLSWYEERPSWLAATVASLNGLCDHIVAVDGAYRLFPDARARSGPEQVEALVDTAHAANIGLTVHRPKEPWRGNEVEKRNHLVQLAMLEAEPFKDWLFRIDADEVVTKVPVDVHARLEREPLDAAGVTLWWRSDLQGSHAPEDIQRMYDQEGQERDCAFLFRALPGMRVESTHFGYAAERTPWRDADFTERADFNDLRVEHRNQYRRYDRMERSQAYYRLRDELGIEHAAV